MEPYMDPCKSVNCLELRSVINPFMQYMLHYTHFQHWTGKLDMENV